MENVKYKLNEKYLTVKGDPVTYMGPAKKGPGFRVKCFSGNEVEVPPTYKLLPFEESRVNGESKSLLKANGHKSKESKPKLAHRIDEFLLKGCHTVSEIVEILKDDPLAAGKNLSANVHARLVTYRRKNITIQKSAEGKIKVLI